MKSVRKSVYIYPNQINLPHIVMVHNFLSGKNEIVVHPGGGVLINCSRLDSSGVGGMLELFYFPAGSLSVARRVVSFWVFSLVAVSTLSW